jgi:hypothetical protein
MPFVADFQQIPYVERFSVQDAGDVLSPGSVFDASRVEMTELRIGSIVYPLRGELTGRFVRALEELFVDGVSPIFVGKGHSAQEATESFSLAVHAVFQELLYQRPFEMTAEERTKWRTVNEIIDVTVYRNTTPIVVRQFGEISWGRLPYPSQIQWDNGYTESVHPRQVDSPDFITFKPGQPVEAFVVRDPLTRELIRVSHISRTRRLRTPREIENSQLVAKVGAGEDLPDADWD